MKITVIGTGYVGLVSGAVFADWGHDVVCLDIDEDKIKMIKKGKMPIYEEGLEELVDKVQNKEKRFLATTNYKKAVEHGEVFFICVGTPSNQSGAADLSYVDSAAKSIGKYMPANDYRVIVTKSTVPVGTHSRVKKNLLKGAGKKKIKYDVASCPEFLREGTSIYDANNSDRTVIGSNSEKALDILEEIYSAVNAPVVRTDIASAELIKYAANAFLATKISFINEMSQICERTGADVKSVAKGMGLDSRIGPKFLNAGIGYGGSCFKPDTLVYVKNSPNLKNISIKDLVKKENEGKKINTLSFNIEARKARISSVSSLTKRNYKGSMVKIKTRMGRKVEVTEDHPILVFEEGEFKIKLAKDINKKDLLPFSSSLPFTKKAPKKVNLINEISKDKYLVSKTILQPLEGYKVFTINYKFIKPYAKKHLKYTHDIKRYNKLPLRVFLDLPDDIKNKIDLNKILLYTSFATKVPALVHLDEKFYRYLGYYLAEGHISKDLGRKNVERERIGLTFHENENEYINEVVDFYKKCGIKHAKRYDKKNTNCCIVVSSRIWSYFLKRYLKLGVNSYTKKFPKFVFRLAPELKFEILRGLFSGDGALSIAHKKYPYIEFATVSKNIAYDTLLILQSLGVVCSINRKFMNISKVKAYIIRISGKRQIEKISSILGKEKQQKIEKMLRNIKYIKSIGYRHLENFNLLPVKDVKTYYYEGEVYSLESSDTTLAVNSGLLVHNCFPKDVEALYRTSSENFYDFRLLRGVMDANERQKYYFFQKVLDKYGTNLHEMSFGVLGAAFKNGTDDIRKSVAIDIIRMLRGHGAKIKLFDPAALENSKKVLGNKYIEYKESAEDVFENVNALLILTEWKDFIGLDYPSLVKKMKEKVIFDGRNILDPQVIEDLSVEYFAVGRTKTN